MSLNYGIFRVQGINTLNDLAQIGSHNKREKKAYKSNPDIVSKSKNNIELVPLNMKHTKGFDELFDYADVPSYYKTNSHNDIGKDDY